MSVAVFELSPTSMLRSAVPRFMGLTISTFPVAVGEFSDIVLVAKAPEPKYWVAPFPKFKVSFVPEAAKPPPEVAI
jgi:hypothetical protein